ncbi:MAG: lytic transglycosylase domain-containing protein [Thiobacillus sp.]|nr:lytic transglycosylase domain-containing protein [Thiobacillus sp.]
MMTRKHIATLLMLGCGLTRPGWADIYTYTADDGAVSLSNVPTDERYTVLIAAPKQEAAAAPEFATRTGKSNLARKAGFDQMVDAVSRTYGMESALLHAVISVESRYNPKAVSKKGAAGLMQLMPKTAKRYGVADAFDPLQNLNGGAHYLRDLLRLFNNDTSLALAAYNAGEHAVMKHGNRIPPYRETLSYVPQVLGFYQRYRIGL